jgi:hypothetical protein
MVTSVNSSSAVSYQQSVNNNQSLTDAQKEALQKIIAQYDPKTATQDQIKSMMDQIKQAGIPPSKDASSIMKQAGFKVHGKHHKGGGQKSSTQQTTSTDSTNSTNSNSSITDLIQTLIQNQNTGNATNNDVNTLIQTLQNSGATTTGNVVDAKV